ncbi:MAG: hypothetical protein L0I76_23095 [Pseudonocardia sp.]|nr:hypothetical protein [Pseudonocardia sp.]
MSKTPAATGRTVKGALLVRGDVVILRGAVVNVRAGSTKKAIRVITGYDHTAHRVVVRHVRRSADVPVVRLVTDEQ